MSNLPIDTPSGDFFAMSHPPLRSMKARSSVPRMPWHTRYTETASFEVITPGAPRARGSIEHEPLIRQAIRSDLVATGAAAVLGDVEGAAHLPLGASPAHEKDRVGVGENVPLADRLVHQVIEQDMRRGVEVEATQGVM